MKVLVTGSNGMLGQDLCPILDDEGYEVIETNRKTLDITDIDNCKRVIQKYMPDIVIHLGAYTDVDRAETEPDKAYKVNVEGTKNIVHACKSADSKLIYISTDYIFDGEKEGEYTVKDKPNPINTYGKTKYLGELETEKYEKHYIIRTSWLFGHHGNNFVEKILIAAKNKKELYVADDQKGCPTWTVELSEGIVKLIEDEKPYGIYNICSKGEISRYEFAKKILKMQGINTEVIPIKSSEIKNAAKRPKNSIMKDDGFCGNFETALKEYMDLRCE